MKRIFKYKLPVDGGIERIDANVIKWLDIKIQDGLPHIWAIVDTEGCTKSYEFIAWGTGWDVPDELLDCEYMGTAIDGYGYVWHYFMDERNNEAELATSKSKNYNIDLVGSTLDNVTYDDYLKNISLDNIDLKNVYNTVQELQNLLTADSYCNTEAIGKSI